MLLKGTAYTFPTIGQIKIGHLEPRENQTPLPQIDPYIRVVSNVRNNFGEWMPHPINEKLHGNQPDLDIQRNNAGELISIPVRIKYDELDLSFGERYEAIDSKTARLICFSNGVGEPFSRNALHAISDGERTCPGPEACPFGVQKRCALMGRLYVQIEMQEEQGNAFIFRTRGWNSVRTLRWQLERLSETSGKHISGVPLTLRMRAKATPRSYGRPIFYLDLLARRNMDDHEVFATAQAHKKEEETTGFPRQSIEARLKALLDNGNNIDTPEDVDELEDWLKDLKNSGDGQEDLTGSSDPADARPATAIRQFPAPPVVAPAAMGLATLRQTLAEVGEPATEHTVVDAPVDLAPAFDGPQSGDQSLVVAGGATKPSTADLVWLPGTSAPVAA